MNTMYEKPINRKHIQPIINVQGDLADGMSFGLIIGGALLLGLGLSMLD